MSLTAVANKNKNKQSKKKTTKEEVIRLRCEEELLARIDRHAARLGMSRSQYIRTKLIESMDREDRDRGEGPGVGGGDGHS